MTDIAERALARAAYQSAHGPQYGIGQCMWRTRELYDAPAIGDYDHDGSADAEDGWKAAEFKHPFDGNYAAVPRGVPFWWSGGSNDNGHVAPTLGAGRCMSTDILRGGYYDDVPLELIAAKWGLRPLGWTEDINGVRVWTPPPPPATRETDMALLADLDAARRKHGASRLRAVRVLLRAVRDAAVNRPIRAARVRAALAAIKGMK